MQYRSFGKLNWLPSALGFGVMRLPIIDGDSARIDVFEATRLIRRAIDGGVNYVDTAWPYHGKTSEKFLGQALKDGYRERVKLTTKMPHWKMSDPADFDRYLDQQLADLDVPSLDFYLLHALNADNWPKVRDLGVLAWAERAIADGRIGHLGFSFHDNLETFKAIVDAWDWTCCQIQYNYLDEDHQAGRKGIEYAAAKGMAVIVMEPLRGGLLAGNAGQRQGRGLPPSIQALWNLAPVRRTPADWALQWLWNQPQVSLLLSGMSTMSQVEQNLASADRSGPGTLQPAELELVARVRDEYKRLMPVPCTECKYCQPCPNGVHIPSVFGVYNEAMMFNAPEYGRYAYANWLPPENRADKCLACGDCETKCPQHIAIIEWLEEADRYLATA